MVPFVQHAPHHQLPPPTPSVYTYSHAPPSHQHPHHHQPIYHQKHIEYVPSATITPLQTQVEYKNAPTIVHKSNFPSVSTTSFRQYYSPGLEYHYTEIVPATKYAQAPSYAYHHSPSQSYQTNYVSQPYYYPQQQQQNHQQQHLPTHHNSNYKGLIDSYIPSYVTYAKQQHQTQQPTYKNYHNYYPSASMQQQQLFTPASPPTSPSYYASYPSQREYNTIAYSVPLPPYDHSKRSTKASLSPKTTSSSSSSSQ